MNIETAVVSARIAGRAPEHGVLVKSISIAEAMTIESRCIDRCLDFETRYGFPLTEAIKENRELSQS